MTPRRIANAVRAGALIRIRRDRYASANLDAHVREAVRIGGRLVSLRIAATRRFRAPLPRAARAYRSGRVAVADSARTFDDSALASGH
ncbi:hypothetical protein JOD62_001303 [Microbacterium keratanolyticum]|nr:hypothetical protein [Microbacterium keratanolyticum]